MLCVKEGYEEEETWRRQWMMMRMRKRLAFQRSRVAGLAKMAVRSGLTLSGSDLSGLGRDRSCPICPIREIRCHCVPVVQGQSFG